MVDADVIARAIGKLEGRLEALIESQAQANKDATASRKVIYARLDGIQRRTEAAETAIGGLQDTVDKHIRPVTDDVRRWRERGIGAAVLLAGLGAVFGGALASVKDRILHALGF